MMLCQKCGKRPANAELTQVIGGQKQHWHLCSQCASEMMGGGWGSMHSFPSILTNMLGNFGAFPDALPQEQTCPQCGMSRRRLSKTGRVGCGHCYEVFGDMLLPYIRSIQGADTHRGAAPTGAAVAESKTEEESPAQPAQSSLQSQLKQAIAEENYELAAQLRDRIREEEGK